MTAPKPRHAPVPLPWPPGYICTLQFDRKPTCRKKLIELREHQAETGEGAGKGTCLLPGTPKWDRPGMMERKR